MSQFTFNIADYRALSAVRPPRTREQSAAPKDRNGGVAVFHRDSDSREWMETGPGVVDIGSIREARRAACPRRGKILRFRNHSAERVYTMPSPEPVDPPEDDPGPEAA